MDKIFLTILNMSLTGVFVIASICLARIFLKKVPKIISYGLWSVAGFRLVFPFSIESIFSLMPFNSQLIPMDIAAQHQPSINSGVIIVDNIVNGVLPASGSVLEASINPLQLWTAIGSFLWITGAAVMIIYGVVSYAMLKRKMRDAVHAARNIYEAEIDSPFVLGVFSPLIYIPLTLSVQERGYIILHEQTHIRRRDPIIKLAGFFILCLHWFNPLVWVAYKLMSVDMEMSCDESVIKDMGGTIKKDYARSLLSLGANRQIINSYTLAFGTGNINDRVKNVLNFKKRSRLTVMSAIVFSIVIGVGCAGNRITGTSDAPEILEEWIIVKEPDTEDLQRYAYFKQIELKKMITQFQGISDAMILLIFPESSESSESSDMTGNNETTASVLLFVERLITEEEGLAIATMIMKSVEGLQLSHIEIMDTENRVVFSGIENTEL